jgi:Tfp pilus assembly protein PilX
MMNKRARQSGSALLIAVFAIALIATLASGMLIIATEEISLMQNAMGAAGAFETAEAGLNDAFSQIRASSIWQTGFSAKAFNGGSYTVDVNNINSPQIILTSTGTTSDGYTAKLVACTTIDTSNNNVIRINELDVNK